MMRLALLLTLVTVSSLCRADDCPTGSTYCVDTPEYRVALAQKMKYVAGLSDGFPQRLIDIYKKVDHCKQAITTAPDGFKIYRIQNSGDNPPADNWEATNEHNDAAQVASGQLKGCYVFLVRRSFACYGAATYDKRPDYDAALDLNMSMAVPCQ